MDAAVFQLPWANVLSGVALTMRAVGFVFVAPVVGAEGVPPQLRGALALLIVVLLAPVVHRMLHALHLDEDARD